MRDIPKEILDCDSAKICAIAAPGAGKTSAILLPKIEQILALDNIDPNEVLLLTFSRMSAIDLKKRLQSLAKSPRASTVHSYSLSFLLSENNHDIRKRVDNILLDFEKEFLLSDLKLLFPEKDRRDLRESLKKFSAAWAQKQHEEIFNEDEDRRAFKQAVINWLYEHEASAMEEIMYHAVDLAKKLPDSPLIVGPKYILVDEFQDLNRLEQEFVTLLAEKSNLLLVVGDPDQSIYSFKYAHREGIKEFGDGKGVKLYEWSISKRCPKKVIEIANQLLKQAEPTREQLLEPLPEAIDGEVHFVRKEHQQDEFLYVLRDIKKRISEGAAATSHLILVPKVKLGHDFVEYANKNKGAAGIPDDYQFSFSAKPEFSDQEQNQILLFGLIANPASVLHFRSYLGIGDSDHFAKEIQELKNKYGNLSNVYQNAKKEDFGLLKRRLRRLCDKIDALRRFINAHKNSEKLSEVIDLLFPDGDENFSELRKMIIELKEDDDDLASLYRKFLDQIRNVPLDKNTFPVMTIMASKGLDADHVYILGCNKGNIPGENRSSYLNDLEYRNEQLRLLFVGFTRAKKSLHILWCRYLPYQQLKAQQTASVRTVKLKGKTYGVVAMSEFLQALKNIDWES